MVALHPPLTLRAVADLDVEAPHDRAHHGQFFLILRRHAGHFDRAAAVRTRHRNRRRVGLVDPRRARAAAVAAILRAGPPSGTPPASLRPVLGKRRGLPATRPACLVQLPFQVLDLLLQALILPLQAGRSCVAASLRRARAPSTSPGAVRGRCAVPQSDAGALSGRRSSRHRYATIPKIVQVKLLTLRPGTR